MNGNHYYKTCEDWLKKLDRNYKQAAPILRRPTAGPKTKWYVYWRLFFLSCAEMFNYDPTARNGWYISHHLFEKP